MEQIDRDTYRLSSGRTFYANCGIIGLSPEHVADETRRDVAEGYDGNIRTGNNPEDFYAGEQPWTDADRAELAIYMMGQWAQWGRVEKGLASLGRVIYDPSSVAANTSG
jgi:hypothetical protein